MTSEPTSVTTPVSTPIAPPQFEATAALAAWKLRGTVRDPEQRVALVSSGGGTSRFPKGRTATVPALFAHRDVGNTSCPGDSGYAQMDPLRDQVQRLIAESATDVRTAWSAQRASLGEPTRVDRSRTTAAVRAVSARLRG